MIVRQLKFQLSNFNGICLTWASIICRALRFDVRFNGRPSNQRMCEKSIGNLVNFLISYRLNCCCQCGCFSCHLFSQKAKSTRLFDEFISDNEVNANPSPQYAFIHVTNHRTQPHPSHFIAENVPMRSMCMCNVLMGMYCDMSYLI